MTFAYPLRFYLFLADNFIGIFDFLRFPFRFGVFENDAFLCFLIIHELFGDCGMKKFTTFSDRLCGFVKLIH